MQVARTLRLTVAAAVLVVVCVFPAQAQQPQDLMEFSIRTPFRLDHSDIVFKAGRFVLYQSYANDPNLFALCREGSASSPVVWISTTRTRGFPQLRDATLVTNPDKSDRSEVVIAGWNVPGDDGWQVIGVYTSN